MEASAKRRSIIKTVLIIFLSVMLVLTFFSNTIMNYSLPEVAAQYAGSGSITAKLRLSATASANSKQEIKIEETRKIRSVAVSEGQDVKIGDVLFYLDDSESSELTAARDELARLEREYALATLTLGDDFYADELAIRNKQKELDEAKDKLNGMTKNASLIASLESERDTLEDRSKALNKQIEAYRKEISKLEGSAAGSSLIGESTDVRLIAAKADYDLAVNAYNSAQTALTTAELAQKLAKTAYESAKTAYDSAAPDGATDLEAISEQIDELEKTMRRAEEDFELALQKLDDELEALDEAYTKAYRDYKEIKADYESGLFDDVTYEEYRAARDKMEAAEAAYDARKAELQPQIDSMTLTYERELEDNTASLEKLKAKKEKLSGVSGLLQAYKTAEQKLEAAEDELAKTNENFTEAETELAEAKREYESLLSLSSIESHEVSLGELEDQAEDIADRMEVISEEIAELGGDVDAKEQQVIIAALSEELSTLKHNLSRRLAQAGIDAKVEEMELSDMLSKIEKQKDLVKKYEDNSTDAKIVADIAGQVGSLTVVNGSETTMGQTLCEIIVADLGYSCEVTFTTEQSRRVRVGDPVEITNMWWSDVKGTIVSIRNDPKSPGTQKIATISLAGDVVDGQSLQLTIGEKGQTYDAVVPNSAVREDNNGKFVLAIEAKNTPLGNRYVARRYDVEVLASDDVNSAVSGLLGSEFIITTSSKPITSGTQVRPVDN